MALVLEKIIALQHFFYNKYDYVSDMSMSKSE